MEIDISDKVNRFIKYAFIALLGAAILVAGTVWYYQKSHRYMKIYDAQVMSTLVNVNVKTTGTVKELLVKNGSHVKAGEKIANIKVDITEDQIKQLEQAVDVAKKNLSKVQEGITITQPIYSNSSYGSEEAAANLEKMEQLYALGAVSANKVEEARSAYNSSQGSGNVTFETIHQASNPQVIKNAEIQLKQAEASLERARKESVATTVTAPVDGTLYYKDIKLDDKVKPGQIIFNIGSNDTLWIEAYIKPDQAEKIQLGQFVSYEVDGYQLKGSVLEIISPEQKEAAGMNTANNSDKITLKISLIPPSGVVLTPGHKATIEISNNEI